MTAGGRAPSGKDQVPAYRGTDKGKEVKMNSTTSSNPGVAVVGMGYWGKNLVRVFHELGALQVVCDQVPARGAEVRQKYPGAAFVENYESVLANPGVRSVVLATPAATHYEMAHRALEAGKDVFVEKPLALRVEDGEELVRMAAQSGQILMVGHILRYHPAVIKLSELIREGELGKIQYLYSNRLNIGRIRTEENILWSFAPHDISVMLALLGEAPCEITCHGGAYLNHAVADVTMSQFLFPSGVRAHIFVSWLHPFKEQRLVVVGSEKMAVFDDLAPDKLVLYPHRVAWKDRVPTAVRAEAEKVPLEDTEPLKVECQHFLDCVRERSRPRTDGEEGLRVLRVLAECEKALNAGRAIRRGVSAAPGGDRPFFVHETAWVDEGCQIGAGTKIWHFCHILPRAKIGERCVLGQNVHVAEGVVIGNNVKIQNNVSVYTGAIIEDNVFLGPSCVLTNVTNPRSEINRHGLYEKTVLRRGCTIGANATIVCGVTVGRYAFVAAGAVVTKDVPDYALVAGNPARQKGWMSRHGHRLGPPDAEGIMVCPESGFRYREVSPGVLRCLDLDEDAPLPESMRVGKKSYREFRRTQ